MDDAALYCVELTEKAFRSQGLALSETVRIGDWEHLTGYPLTVLAMQYGTRLVLDRPITTQQEVYLPGNERQGVWASSLLETVVGPELSPTRKAIPSQDAPLTLRGDVELALFAAGELRRSYAVLPVQLACDLVRLPQVREFLAEHSNSGDSGRRASPATAQTVALDATHQTSQMSRPRMPRSMTGSICGPAGQPVDSMR